MYIYDQEISEALSWVSAISCFMLFCGVLSHNSKWLLPPSGYKKGGHAIAIAKQYRASLNYKNSRATLANDPLVSVHWHSVATLGNEREKQDYYTSCTDCNMGNSDTMLPDVRHVVRGKFFLGVRKLYRVVPFIGACTSGDAKLHRTNAFCSLSCFAVHCVVCMRQQ